MKKGFTLIELLAVIVILAIIIVVAVPRVIDITSKSRNSSWVDTKKLIKKALEIDYFNDDFTAVTSASYCDVSGLSGTALSEKRYAFKNRLKKVIKIDTTSISIGNPTYDSATSKCTFKITAISTGQFAGESSATYKCTLGKCTY